MGPPIFIGGNRNRYIKQHLGAYASMGPPIFIGGNPVIEAGAYPHMLCFNGAADFHRRKFQVLCFVSCIAICFNGAADFHRRKFSETWVVDACFDGGFNGAADFHRRKYWHPMIAADEIAIASMGPPIFIGGNPDPLLPLIPIIMLQWGRRFSSAEMPDA